MLQPTCLAAEAQPDRSLRAKDACLPVSPSHVVLFRLILFVTCFLVAGGPLNAQTRTVMVMGVSGQGVPELERGRIRRELNDAVRLAGLGSTTDSTDTTIDELDMVMGCATVTPRCMAEFAELVGADVLVWATTAIFDRMVEVQARVYDVATESVQHHSTLLLPSTRGPTWLPVRLAGEWTGRPVVEFTSPDPAAVVVDGIPMGALPVTSMDLIPGMHRVIYQFADGLSVTRVVEVPARGIIVLDARAAESLAPPQAGRAGTRTAGVALWGGAVLAATIGGVLLSNANALEGRLENAATQREAWDLADRGRSFNRGANVLFVVSGSLLSVGTALFAR